MAKNLFGKIHVQGVKSSHNGFTLLHRASFANQPIIIDYLIKKSVYLNEQDHEGMTALDYACTLETINILTKQGAIHGSPVKALFNAFNRSYDETFEYLLDNKLANIEDKDEEGQTVLHMAVSYKYEKIDYLISKGANVNATDNLGNTPLILAAHNYDDEITEIVRSLLNHNPDLEAKDLDGMTALHWAAKRGYADAVKLLVAKNANSVAVDNSGKTPLELAGERADGDQLQIV